MRFGLVAIFIIGGLMVVGRDAEAQARGSLQATATVVDTRQGFEALSAVQQAVTNSGVQRKAVATVALVSTERSAIEQKVVVTVDFVRN